MKEIYVYKIYDEKKGERVYITDADDRVVVDGELKRDRLLVNSSGKRPAMGDIANFMATIEGPKQTLFGGYKLGKVTFVATLSQETYNTLLETYQGKKGTIEQEEARIRRETEEKIEELCRSEKSQLKALSAFSLEAMVLKEAEKK